LFLIQVQRKQGEPFSRTFSRWRRLVEQSGIILEAKKRRFFQQRKNKRKTKEAALQREKIKKYKEILRRTGELGPNNRIMGKIDLDKLN